jgi:hypothetical protein
MKSGCRIWMSKARAIACWSILCLLLALFSLSVPTAPAFADEHHRTDTHHVLVELISAPMDDHSDCDHGLADMTGHCHTTPSCFAYAPAVASIVSIDLQASGHPEPLSESNVASRSPQPNLQPPKRSIQA